MSVNLNTQNPQMQSFLSTVKQVTAKSGEEGRRVSATEATELQGALKNLEGEDLKAARQFLRELLTDQNKIDAFQQSEFDGNQFTFDATSTRKYESVEVLPEVQRMYTAEDEPLNQINPGIRNRYQGQMQKPRSYPTLEAALDAVNKSDAGDEAIFEVKKPDGSKEYQVFDIKSNTSFEDLLMPGVESKNNVIISRGDRRVEVHPKANQSFEDKVAQAKELARVPIKDEASGFDHNQAYNQRADRMPAYQANLGTSLTEVNSTLEEAQQKKQDLTEKLDQLKVASPPDQDAIETTQQELTTLEKDIAELDHYKTLLTSKMQLLPKSNSQGIPGTDQKIGEHRNHPEKVVDNLTEELQMVESRLMSATDPDEIAGLNAQKEQLVDAIRETKRSGLQVKQAQLNTNMRVGSLATISSELDKAKTDLESKVKQLEDYKTQLRTAPSNATAGLRRKITALEADIEKTRSGLIKTMETELETFKKYAPRRGGGYAKGAQDSIDLLQLQIDKIKSLSTHKAPQILEAVKETQDKLLASVQDAAKHWDGISPKEGTMLEGITEKTDSYLRKYEQTKEDVKAFDGELKEMEELMKNPPTTPVGKGVIPKIETAYTKELQDILKNAKEGTKLHKFAQYLQAAQMAAPDSEVDSDLKKRIDTDKIQAKVAELAQDPEIQKAFELAKERAIKKEFGNSATPAKDLKEHLLSDKFHDYLRTQPEAKQKEIIATELEKLTFLDPQMAKEAAHELMGRSVKDNAHLILAKAPPAQRKDAMTQVMNTVLDDASKGGKLAGSFGTMMEKLTPEEVAKMTTPNKTYEVMAKKLEEMGDTKALGKLKELHMSGKLKGMMGIVAAVSMGAKWPPADGWATASMTGSAMGLPGNAIDIAKMFGAADEVFEVGGKMAKLSKVSNVLGPIGDGVGLVVDTYGSYKDFSNGDYVGGSAKAVGAAASGTGLVAGVLIAAGASGPAAPVVLVGATVVGLLAWGADALWGESEEETMLRQLGVLKPD